MFEKEAEEYVSEYRGYGWQPHKGSAVFTAMVDCYETGAEFGYNKAKEEIRKELLELRADSFDAGMFLRVDETLRNLGIKEE